MIRVGRVLGRDIGPFKEIDIDLEAIPGNAIAIVGENGAGKSTFLEAITGGGCFRECANRGLLVGLAQSSEAFLQVDVTNGHAYTIRHELDGVARNGDSVVTRDGADVLPDRLVRSFDAWAAKTLPSPKVLYATTVSPQRGKGLLEMTRGDRAKVILEALGCERLDEQKAQARSYASAAGVRAEVSDARLQDERGRALSVETAEQAWSRAAGRVAADRQAAEEKGHALARAREELEKARAHNAEVERKAQAFRQAQDVRNRADQRVRELQARQSSTRAAIADADQVRAAAAALAETESSLTDARQALADRRGEHSLATEKLSGAERALDRVRYELRGATEHIGAIEKAIESLGDLTDAPKLAAAQKAATESTDALEASERELEALRSAGLASAEERAGKLRSGLESIRDEYGQLDDACKTARDTLATDDALLKARAERPKEIAALAIETSRKREAVRQATRELDRITSIAFKAERAEEARGRIARFETDAARYRAEIEQLERDAKAALERAQASERAVKAARERLSAVEAARAVHAPLAARAGVLSDAEARLAEISVQITEANRALQVAQEQLASLAREPPVPPAPLPDVEAYEDLYRRAEESLAQGRTAEALRQKELEQARASAEKIAQVSGELESAREEQADWTRIASDIEGVKMMTIDAAGPELTRRANAFLHECVGPRFTVTVETQRADSKGKKLLEGVDIRVLDCAPDKEREGAGESFSPGEQVILNEALSLALTEYACSRSGIAMSDVMLFRDETGSALNEKSGAGAAYLAMLRKVGARKVFFVSHVESVIAQADAWIEVGDGKLTVRT